jgi:hypothetical protein
VIAKKPLRKRQFLDTKSPALKGGKKKIKMILIPQWRRNGKLHLHQRWVSHQR